MREAILDSGAERSEARKRKSVQDFRKPERSAEAKGHNRP
jgi:hypothetical protein